MKWKKIFSGATALAVCSAAAKLMGAFFRIPLTNIIGAEGIGLYQMVFPLYTVLLTVSSGGLSTAISKLVAVKQIKSDNGGALKILRVSVVAFLVLAGAATVFLLLFRGKIAAVQGNPLVSTAYLGIAPAIVFVAIIACLRGYFQGCGNMLPSGLSQIIEQGVKLFSGLYFAALLMRYGVEYAVFGALIGVSLSEFAAVVYLAVQFSLHRAKAKRNEVVSLKRLKRMANFETAEFFDPVSVSMLLAPPLQQESKTRDVLRDLYRIAIPVTLGSLIMPLTQVIDSVMVINVLTMRGMDRAEATSLFGLTSGPIGSLINLPLVVTLAISISLLPKIASWKENASDGKGLEIIGNALKFALLTALPCMAVFLFFSQQTVGALYSRGLTAEQLRISADLLKIESLSVLFIGLIQVSTSVLQGADLAARPAINLLYGAVVKVLLTLILLPLLGIAGAAIASVACYGTTAAMDIYHMRKVAHFKLNFFKTVLMPLTGSVLLIGITFLSLKLLTGMLPKAYAYLASLFLGGIAYGAFLILTKTVKIKEFFN